MFNVLTELEATNFDSIDRSWNYLMDYYRIVSPKMFIAFTSGQYTEPRCRHLASVLSKGIYLYLPSSNEPEYEDVIKTLEKHFRPVYGPVSYIGTSGKRVTTIAPVRIGSVYMMLLEKTGDDWTAVSSGKLQAFGVLSQVTNNDKFSQPSRNQAIRALGESEVRIYAAYAGSKITADLIDRNNSPVTHKQMLESILRADKPTNIETSVDRVAVPIGNSKPQLLVKHMCLCSGFRFVYKKRSPVMQK